MSEVFSPKMGYTENTLPRYLARLGADVHLVTTGLRPYYYRKDSQQTYQNFTGDSESFAPGRVEQRDGFTWHVLGHRTRLGYIRMVGLRKKLIEIQPDIVQTETAIGWLPLDAALFKFQLGYKLFTGSHYHASVFPLANRKHHLWDPERLRVMMLRFLPGRAISLCASKCYPITSDCAEVAARFFGVPWSKMEICPLGVDIDIFRPTHDETDRRERRELRVQFGVADHEIICIYTGRFSQDKNPLLLAKAIDRLAEMGEPYRGLFVGEGVQGDEIRQQRYCCVNPFVDFRELPRFFRAADVGVWPTQESMSMLDASACGLPIVVNDTVKVTEQIEGSGLIYRLNDCDDLIRVLLSLREPMRRRELGGNGAKKMRQKFGWDTIAKIRMRGYKAALNHKTKE
jgi:glycosyltransferase involved in cell wall biosynthesis